MTVIPRAWTAPRAGGPRTYLDTTGAVTDLVWATANPYGDQDATCHLATGSIVQPAALHTGRVFGITIGAVDVWTGTLADPTLDDSGWQVQADGDAADLQHYLAIASGGNAFNLQQVLPRAISAGARISDITALPAPPAGLIAASGSQTITDSLDGVAAQLNKRWALERGRLTFTSDPTSATLMVAVEQDPGRATAEYASAVGVTYINSATATKAFVLVGGTDPVLGTREVPLDLTSSDRQYTTAQATQAGQRVLAQSQAGGLTWSGGLTVLPGRCWSAWGGPVDPLTVSARGQRVRVLILDTARDGQTSPVGAQEFTVGRWECHATDGTAQVTPIDSSNTDLQSVLTKAAA